MANTIPLPVPSPLSDSIESSPGSVDLDAAEGTLVAARELADLRERFARTIERFAATTDRDLAIPDDGDPQRLWSFEEIEACWLRTREIEEAAGVSPEIRRLGRLMRRIEGLRNAIVQAHLRLVYHLAGQWASGPQLTFMDLVQEGSIGLMRAVDQFDPDRGNQFSTYAYWWIRQSISKALDEKARLIRFPSHVHQGRRAIRKAQQALHDGTEHAPTAGEIARQAGISERRTQKLLALGGDANSLDAGDDDPDAASWQDRLSDDQPSPLELLLDGERRERLAAAFEQLSPRQRTVLRLRFGLDGDASYTLQEIGEKVGLTRERVRQIERAALDRLKVDVREGAPPLPGRQTA